MRRKRPARVVGRCPECLSPHAPDVVATVRAVLNNKDACTIGCCDTCGHLIVCGLTACRTSVEGCVLEREFFVEHFSEKDRAELHETQELVHHANGHWG